MKDDFFLTTKPVESFTYQFIVKVSYGYDMFAKKWYRKSNTVIFFFESAHSLQVLNNTFSESSAEEEQRFRDMCEKKNFEKNYTRGKKNHHV